MKGNKLSRASLNTPAAANKKKAYYEHTSAITLALDGWTIIIDHISQGSRRVTLFTEMMIESQRESIAKLLVYGSRLDYYLAVHTMTAKGFAEAILNECNQRIALDLATMVVEKLNALLSAKTYDHRIAIDRRWHLDERYTLY